MKSVDYNKANSQDQAFEFAKKKLNKTVFKQYKIDVDFSLNEENYSISGNGKGFSFNCNFYDDHLTFDLDLSLFLKPLRGKIESSIVKELKKYV